MCLVVSKLARLAAIAGLLLGSPAFAAPLVVKTTASAKIDESAAITVLNNAPLQLLLTMGAPMGVTYTAPSTGSAMPASASGDSPVGLPLIAGSGFLGGVTGSGEVLSVSMGAVEGIQGENDGKKVAVVLAQFN